MTGSRFNVKNKILLINKELPVMNNLKDSIILMGINWSKAAKIKAFKDIKVESPDVAKVISDLDYMFSKENV
tara:strand:- start:4336 stop:4551 length:216 start_codon:yes stop_codon:yes gene_type:complete